MMAAADRTLAALLSAPPRGGRFGSVRVHRGRLQRGRNSLGAGLPRPGGVREGRFACGRYTPKGGVKGGNGIGVDSDSDSCVCEARARAVARQRRHALERLALADGSPGRLRLRVWRLRVWFWCGRPCQPFRGFAGSRGWSRVSRGTVAIGICLTEPRIIWGKGRI